MSAAPRLVSVATALPPHVVRQQDARVLVGNLFAETLAHQERLLEVFDNAGIDQRCVCAPLEWYGEDHTFEQKNDRYVECAVQLAVEVARRALERAGLEPADVDHVVFVSTTGLATPSIDARLANLLHFRSDTRRTPIWGLGCAGGAAGLARARDFALAAPESRVLVIALELCSLTFQRNDRSKRNLVATSLFGDGAAGAVIAGSEANGWVANGRRTLDVLASQSTLWEDTLDIMGWTVDGAGLHVVFSRDIPTIVRDRVRPSLDGFLAAHDLTLESLEHLVAHPGGTKVLQAYSEALGVSPEALRHSRAVLRDCGNMSSPTCLFVLERFLEAHDIDAGEHAVVAALGPGFASEYVLLRGAGS